LLFFCPSNETGKRGIKIKKKLIPNVFTGIIVAIFRFKNNYIHKN
jgi:hypothetical protein